VGTEKLVEDWVEAGGQIIRGLTEAGVRVLAACWARDSDGDKWVLYLSLPLADRDGPLAAYREVQKALRFSKAEGLTISDIVVVGEGDPITKSILGFWPHRTARIQTQPALVGSILATGLYVYPPDESPSVASGNKVIVPESLAQRATATAQVGGAVIRPGTNTASPFTKSPTNGR